MHITLLHLATELPGVDRVLVNAAIKRQLCLDVAGDRSWLHLSGPGMAIPRTCTSISAARRVRRSAATGARRRRATAATPRCDWWFAQLDKPRGRRPRRRAPVTLPAACTAILAGKPE